MTRYVLSQRGSGLGDCLMSLVSAWRYARATGRTLVIDWRGSGYLPDRSTNLFPLLFEPPTEIAGVPVLVAPADLTGPWWPTAGVPPPPDDERLRADWLFKARAQSDFETQQAVAMIKSGDDVPAASVRFSGCLPVLPEPDLCRTVLECLKPARVIVKEERRFARQHLRERALIGVHIRHGNGGDVLSHTKYWDPVHAPVDSCVKTIQEVRSRVGGNAPVLVCTDSLEVLGEIAQRVTGVIAREKLFLPPGAGELHLSGMDTAADALVEMLLLRRSTVLVRHPPNSYFSWWPSLYVPEIVSPFDLDRP